jgi:hypothetical protein
LILVYPDGQLIKQLVPNNEYVATQDKHEVLDVHIAQGVTHTSQLAVVAFAKVPSGQVVRHLFPVKYTLGMTDVLQDVQFVNELLQVAQGEVQGLHTDPD